MPGLFSRLKSRDGARSKKKNATNDFADALPEKPKWDDAYARKTVEPEEIHELIRCCTDELKARGLDHPFLLLPFRPTSDPSAVRTFIRNFFDQHSNLKGEMLGQELRMTEPMVIAGVAKWCWSRLQGGIVGWDAYELFKVGEIDSNMARDSFKTFIPISVENGARQRIIFDFFDLMAALVSHSKANGFGGRKLSRMAAWWAFERKESDSNGFEGGYNAWLNAADATSHLFFAYLRSLSPEQSVTGISMLPTSLHKLLQETEYPPMRPDLLMASTNKVVMIVDAVSPTPFALLRRANHFQYRDTDRALQEFSEFEDPIQALTEECRRVLKAISAANQSQVSSSKHSTSLRDASWSRFEDIGFASALEEDEEEDESAAARKQPQGLRNTPASGGNRLARPTTPSWADFLSSGFVDDGPVKTNMLLPPDKVLPPIDTQTRQRSSQSHRPRLESDSIVEPGELASITLFDLDEAFWWVWMSSLAPEETPERKSAFGRCAVVETKIRSGRWLVMEEIIAGAAPEPVEGAYIAEKKGFFSWTRRGKSLGRRKSTGKHALDRGDKTPTNNFATSKTSIGPDTHARIQAKAAQLRAAENNEKLAQQNGRRGRTESETMHEKTNSVFTLQPTVVNEAKSAMRWANKYDKGAIKEAYLADSTAGRGLSVSPAPLKRVPVPTASPVPTNGHSAEQPPEVPSKAPMAAVDTPKSPMTAPSPISSPNPPVATPAPEEEPADQLPPPVSTADESVAEQPEPEDSASPLPPPKDDEPADPAPPAVVAPEPAVELSPESKKQHKKLHKESREKPAGFRKLFGRKNRASKLPENASANLNGMLKQEEAAAVPIPETPAEQPTPAATPSPAPEEVDPKMSASAEGVEPTLETPRAEQPEPVYDPTAGEDLSRVNTQDAAEANKEFARFDQGPLADQPAFVPPGDDEDDATPPPIARHTVRSETSLASKHAPERPKEVLRDGASPVIQDRWAQIRKNAAERAATRQSEEQSHGAQSKTDGDDDTSGEETIESRVARIKARVAELTGTMEGSNAPRTPEAPQKSYP